MFYLKSKFSYFIFLNLATYFISFIFDMLLLLLLVVKLYDVSDKVYLNFNVNLDKNYSLLNSFIYNRCSITLLL